MADPIDAPPGYDPVQPEPSAPYMPSSRVGALARPLPHTLPSIASSYDAPAGYEPVATPSMLETYGRGAIDGATFGFDGKINAKEAKEAAQKANPWTYFAGQLSGGALPMVAATFLPGGQAATVAQGSRLAASGARALSATRAAMVPSEINTMGQAALQGSKIGSVYGGLSGAGHANVADDDTVLDAAGKRIVGGAAGAGEGAILGPIFGVAGRGVYRGAQALGGMKAAAAAETDGAGRGALTTLSKNLERDNTSPQNLIDQIKSEFPDDSSVAGINKRFWGNATSGGRQPITSDQVEETVRRAMAGDSAQEISQALSPNGKGSGPGKDAVQTLLDELAERHLGPLNIVDRASLVRTGSGDNTQMTMRAAAATPGEHVGVAREALLGRQVGSGGRLSDMFDRIVGSSDYDGVAASHAQQLQDAGARAYGTAFAQESPFDLNPVFNKWAAKYGNMRGPIPDAIMGQLNNMRTVQPVLDAQGNLAVVPKGGLVNQAPPMNLESFMMARQGLADAKDAAVRSGNKNLSARLNELYGDLSDTVGAANPEWVKANQIWRDGKSAEDAMAAGAKMSLRLNSGSRENLAEFTDAQGRAQSAAKDLRDANKAIAAASKTQSTITPEMQSAADTAQAQLDAANSRMELFKVGLVRSLNDAIVNKGETDNLTKQLLLPGARQVMTKVLGDDAADQFLKTVRAEAAMKRTYASQFGSQTTPLKEAKEDLNWAPSYEAAWSNLGIGKVLQLAQDYAAKNINATRNKQLMGLYTEMDPLKQLDTLRAAQTVHAARVNAGNAFGTPVVSSVGPMLDAALGGPQSMYQHDPRRPTIVTSRPPRANDGN